MWDGSAHLNTDRNKNVEIRPGTECTSRWRETERHNLKSGSESTKEGRGGGGRAFTLCVSFSVQTELSNTKKMNCYFEGRRGAVLSNECVVSGKGEGVVFTWTLVKELFW